MVKKNLTLSLPPDLLKRAKVYAAQHDTNINTLVRTLLEEKVSDGDQSRAAGRRFLEIAASGPFSDVDPRSISREQMHERH